MSTFRAKSQAKRQVLIRLPEEVFAALLIRAACETVNRRCNVTVPALIAETVVKMVEASTAQQRGI